ARRRSRRPRRDTPACASASRRPGSRRARAPPRRAASCRGARRGPPRASPAPAKQPGGGRASPLPPSRPLSRDFRFVVMVGKHVLRSDPRPMAEARVIKRYANRKLYDTQRSRYVTLDQIADMIRDGEDVKIVDNNSKEDLTTVTLAQIIFEEEKKQKSFLPLNAMRN